MEALLIAFVAAGVLTVGMLPTIADAQQIGVGVNVGAGNNGYGYDYDCGMGGGRWHYKRHQPHYHMVKTWRHHHPMWVQKCRGQITDLGGGETRLFYTSMIQGRR